VRVITVTGKALSGEVSEVTDQYIVLVSNGTPTQVMVHAIVAIAPAGGQPGGQG
jgi:sRNA-binding regulator protein Hfq